MNNVWPFPFACATAFVSLTSVGMAAPIVTISPEILGGTPVFAGTRVPVQNLLDCLKAGDSIEEFLDAFPSVHREQVELFLDEAQRRIAESCG